MRQATITDIAKRLNISTSTVSRALSDHPDIKEQTKKLVRTMAKELDYTPNQIAQGLKNNKTSTIGVIVPEIEHDFFSSAISGIEELAYQSGYTIIVCQSNENVEREILNTNALMNHRVAGVIVSIAQNTKNGDHFKNLIHRGLPLVFFDRVCADVDAYKVVIDDCKSAFEAVSYLIQKGYKRIAHFTGAMELDICKHRFEGYKEALNKAEIPFDPDLICFGGLFEQDGYKAMNYLLSQNITPNAVFAVNDPVAIGAFQRIKEAGLTIPGDIGLVGFSNNKITNLIDPSLTTVDQPAFEMGKKSAEILISMIEKKISQDMFKTVVLKSQLIIRKST